MDGAGLVMKAPLEAIMGSMVMRLMKIWSMELRRGWRGLAGGYGVLGAGLALAATVLAMPVAVSAAGKPVAVIKMSDKPPRFIPETVTIKVGDTVEWVNNAKTLHSVDADPSMVQRAQDVVLPKGAKPFDSGFMQPGGTFDYTFTVPGTYKYTCVPHEKDAMNGTIIVK